MSATHNEESNSGMEEIRGMLHELTAEVQQLKDDHQSRSQEPYRKENFKKNHKQDFTRHDHQPNTDMNFQQPYQATFDPSRDQYSYKGQRGGYNTYSTGRGRGAEGPNGLPICYNCGQEGHIKAGCRIRTDHLKQPLNSRGPVSRGKP